MYETLTVTTDEIQPGDIVSHYGVRLRIVRVNTYGPDPVRFPTCARGVFVGFTNPENAAKADDPTTVPGWIMRWIRRDGGCYTIQGNATIPWSVDRPHGSTDRD